MKIKLLSVKGQIRSATIQRIGKLYFYPVPQQEMFKGVTYGKSEQVA